MHRLTESSGPEQARTGPHEFYNIGETAERSGVSSKMIRYYESIGLLSPAARTPANYRVYRERDVNQLRFIRRARDLGFSVKQITQLVSLWQDAGRSSADVKALALDHVTEMEQKINEMQEMRDALLTLAQRCQGDQQAECPILDSLACQHSATRAKMPHHE